MGTNLLDIDRWTQDLIVAAGGVSCYVDYAPPFGRGPFGHYICTSVNDAVLHGRPHDYTLAEGDLLSLDLAVATGGVAADAAISFLVGDSRPPESVALIDATERALAAGIAPADVPLDVVRTLPATLREAKSEVTVVTFRESPIAVERGDSRVLPIPDPRPSWAHLCRDCAGLRQCHHRVYFEAAVDAAA